MQYLRYGLFLIACAALSACRLEISVPFGGNVVSESGSRDCGAGNTCAFEVSDTDFRDTFTAVPDENYQFIGWKKGPAMLCGWSIGPCTIETSGFAGNDALMEVLESDLDVYIQPTFIAEDAIRVYQAGDVAVFAGRLTVTRPGSLELSSRVLVKKEYLPVAAPADERQALIERTTVSFNNGDEDQVTEVQIWQDSVGTLLDISDTDGNAYLNADSNDEGLLSIPTPLVGHESILVNFYSLFGGHTSGPITRGSRSIDVSMQEGVSVPLGEFPSYPVIHSEAYEYLSTFGDHKRGSSVETERHLWVSPAKGVIRIVEVRSEYSNFGALQVKRALAIEAVRANY